MISLFLFDELRCRPRDAHICAKARGASHRPRAPCDAPLPPVPQYLRVPRKRTESPLRPPDPLRPSVPLRQVVSLRRRNGFSPSFSGFSAPRGFQRSFRFQCFSTSLRCAWCPYAPFQDPYVLRQAYVNAKPSLRPPGQAYACQCPIRQVVSLRRRNGFSPSCSGFSAPHRFQCPFGFQ